MHKKKPLVPEKYFGSLPGDRCEEPLAASLAELVPLPPNLGPPIFSSGSMQAFLPTKEKAGWAVQPAWQV